MALPRVFRFLAAHQVKFYNHSIEHKAHFVLSETLLRSALDAPSNHQHYINVQDPALLAAILSSRIIRITPLPMAIRELLCWLRMNSSPKRERCSRKPPSWSLSKTTVSPKLTTTLQWGLWERPSWPRCTGSLVWMLRPRLMRNSSHWLRRTFRNQSDPPR